MKSRNGPGWVVFKTTYSHEASGAASAAVVSHGAAIRAWVAANVTNMPPVFAQENHLDNAGVVVVDGSFEQGWQLASWQGRPIEDFGAPGTPIIPPPRPDVHDPAGESLSEARADEKDQSSGNTRL